MLLYELGLCLGHWSIITFCIFSLLLFPKNMLPSGCGHYKYWVILTRTLTVTWATPLLCLRGSGTVSLPTSVILITILNCDSTSLSSESNSFIIPDTKMKGELYLRITKYLQFMLNYKLCKWNNYYNHKWKWTNTNHLRLYIYTPGM